MNRTLPLLGLALGLGGPALPSAQPPAPPVAPQADRSRPPSPGPLRPLRLPSVQRLALANGLPVLLVESHEVPVATVLLVVRSGAAADPLDQVGVAALTADMLDEGAGGRDALAVADAFELLGAELRASAAWDSSTVSLNVPVARLSDALPLLADVALRPDFPDRELQRLRREAMTRLLQNRADPRQVAAWALVQGVFGRAHRYGRPLEGDAESLRRIGAAELKAFHGRHYQPANAALVVVGDLTRDVVPLLEKSFGAWPRGSAPLRGVPEPARMKGRRVLIIDRPGAAQSVIRVGHVGPPRRTPDHAAIEVMNTLLGASFTSRLNDNLREQHGWAYGAGSAFGYRLVAGDFRAAADVQTQSTGPALAELVKELDRIRSPASAEEIERARGYLALGFAQDFETTRQIADKVAEQFVYELPEDAFSSFVPRALAVDVEQARAAARRHVDAGNLTVVVVGDRKAIEQPIRALNLGPVEVLTVEQVMGPPPGAGD